MTKVTTRTPGKIHLMGEHAVVYGEPALIAAVGLFSEITLSECEVQNQIILSGNCYSSPAVRKFAKRCQRLQQDALAGDFSQLFAAIGAEPDGYQKLVVGTILNHFRKDAQFKLNQKIEFSLGTGLGSSAAFAVGVAAAITRYLGITFDRDKNNQLAYQIETLTAGKVSGGDNACSNYGSIIKYQAGKAETLSVSAGGLADDFYLIDTGPPALTTGELVGMVAKLPDSVRAPEIKRLGRLTEEMIAALKTQSEAKVISCLNQAHGSLSQLGVSTPRLNELQAIISGQHYGGAKLCGAGGGGMLLACIPQASARITDELNLVRCQLGAPGVQFL